MEATWWIRRIYDVGSKLLSGILTTYVRVKRGERVIS